MTTMTAESHTYCAPCGSETLHWVDGNSDGVVRTGCYECAVREESEFYVDFDEGDDWD